MFRILAAAVLFLISVKAEAQVSRQIKFTSSPAGAIVANVSGRTVILGNAPLKDSIEFHSEVSVIKIRFSACGYYDTIIKVTPQTDSVKIVLDRKKLVILPETQEDVLPENEYRQISLLLRNYLEDFSKRNIRQPVNFMDFAIMKKSGQRTSITLTFEVDPQNLQLPRIIKSDSLLQKKWEDLFSGSQKVLKTAQGSMLRNTDLFFSLMAGKKNISIRHIPGVDVSDELRVEVSRYEDATKVVTTTTYYYETVTNPTFNTSLDQNQRYSEFLYRLSPGQDNGEFRLSGMAAMSFLNGKMSTLFESEPRFGDYSMLLRFLSRNK